MICQLMLFFFTKRSLTQQLFAAICLVAIVTANLTSVLPAGMLGSDSWPAPTEFLDFLKIMDAEEEELVDEEKEKERAKEEVMEEDEAHSSSSEHVPEKKATVHSEL